MLHKADCPALSQQPDERTEESGGQLLQRLGVDGKLWAEEMHKRFPAIAEDDLLGWCCNMIMAGYDEAQRRAMKRESGELEKLEHELLCGMLMKSKAASDFPDTCQVLTPTEVIGIFRDIKI